MYFLLLATGKPVLICHLDLVPFSIMNDIFISYAHLDDKPLTEGQKGWITKLHRILEVRLGQLLGEEPQIWRDPKLSGNDVFGQSIAGEFKKARVMVSVMTPLYVKSEWCVRELSGFIDAAEEGGALELDDKSRVFKVVKTPITADEVPDKLRNFFDESLGCSGAEFFINPILFDGSKLLVQ